MRDRYFYNLATLQNQQAVRDTRFGIEQERFWHVERNYNAQLPSFEKEKSQVERTLQRYQEALEKMLSEVEEVVKNKWLLKGGK